MATKPQKKARIRNTADLDLIRMYGSLPSYDNKNPETDPEYNLALGHALNWCSRGLEPKSAKDELVFWMKTHKYSSTAIESISYIDDNYLGTVGALAFLTNNGFPLTPTINVSMISKLEKFIKSGAQLKVTKDKETSERKKIELLKKQNMVSPETQHHNDALEISDFVEDSLFANYTVCNDRLNVLADQYKSIVLGKAIDHLNELKDEIELTKTDKDLAEAYSYITKRNINKIIKGYSVAITVIENAMMNKSVSRKPRKLSKPKSAAQQIHTLKYRKEDKSMKVKSFDPMLIVGAAKIIVFNTKTRKLGIYMAKDDKGFSVKGTTIHNFDEQESTQKTIRAIKNISISDTVGSFRRAPKIKSSKLFNEVKTMETKLNGRLSDDILLLKAYR